jgi:hypothetical protein
MAHLMNAGGKKITYHEWVRHMGGDERAELIDALAPYMDAASTGPISLSKFQIDFSNMGKEDQLTFIKCIQSGINMANAVINEAAVDAALQAEIDKGKPRSAAAKTGVPK